MSKYASGFMGGGANSAPTPTQSSPQTAPTIPTQAAPSNPPTNTQTTPSKPAVTTTAPLSEAEGFEVSSDSVFSELACSDAMEKTNGAIAQIARSVFSAKDAWGIYGYAQKLSKTSETLNNDCATTNLKLVNSGRTGVNKTQDLACKKLIQIIENIIVSPPTEVGPPTDYKALSEFSKTALGLAKYLGKKCEIHVVDKDEEIPKAPAEKEINNIDDLFADDEEEEVIEEEEEGFDEVPVLKSSKAGEDLDSVAIQFVDSKGKIGNILTLCGDKKRGF